MNLSDISPAEIATAQITFDEEDHAIVAGSVVTSLGFTAAAVGMLAPREWENLADYLTGLLDREPLTSSRIYAGHRIVLGNLASELRGYAFAAGLRPSGSAEAFHDHITEVIEAHRAEVSPATEPSIPTPEAPNEAL